MATNNPINPQFALTAQQIRDAYRRLVRLETERVIRRKVEEMIPAIEEQVNAALDQQDDITNPPLPPLVEASAPASYKPRGTIRIAAPVSANSSNHDD